MRCTTFLAPLLLAVTAVGVMAEDRIRGVASFRERLAVPPAVVFEARLEDVSRADVPSRLLGRAVIENAGNPPYRFAIEFDPSLIDERGAYAVRASLRHEGRLLFTSDTQVPVLTRGAASEVDILLVRAPSRVRASARMIGEFTYFADAALFSPCGSDRRYPVAAEGDYLALERAYLRDRQAPGEALVAVLEAQLAPREGMEGGTRETLVIERTVGAVPGLTCERALADSPIENTYWRILSLAGEPVDADAGRREPSIRFLSRQRGYSATVGCNTINGGYELAGNALSLAPGATTMMACPPPLDQTERRLIDALGEVATVSVTGPTAELSDGDGRQLLFMEAVALR